MDRGRGRPALYFACPVRGRSDGAVDLGAVMDVVAEFGEVLTEHLRVAEDLRARLADGAIHRRQMDWLLASDAVVAEITAPSHGVGYEVAIAVEREIPVLALRHVSATHGLSAMFGGDDRVHVEVYERPEDVRSLLRRFLDSRRTEDSPHL